MNLRKFNYYLINGLITLTPPPLLRALGKHLLSLQSNYDQEYIKSRVDYYNQLSKPFSLTHTEATAISRFKKTGGTTYYFDLFKVIKAFTPSYILKYVNGDVTDVPTEPSFVKSRPLHTNNANSVMLKLNAIRHYVFIKDSKAFAEKKNMLVWRGAGFRENRKRLLQKYVHHTQCNLGESRPISADPHMKEFKKEPLTIEEQLKYKFILSLEGRDVATNLKWIMSSNSLCFTPKLRYETWFMEGKLQAGIHFVEVKDDFSDLIEKMDYYTKHEDEALEIIKNANQWVEQFKDSKREKLISLLVAQKYFDLSGQSSAKN
ncbi:glycosyl transferase family 90 [Aliivibrio fischeri]|uniref:glycosyl transferase family 90 n=1 Tax=Aliivibrio fischeri TaxID=668 RepID=UPI0007C50F26|nr:glycosyl transferase family 90 [Aliivibrio fischeri]